MLVLKGERASQYVTRVLSTRLAGSVGTIHITYSGPDQEKPPENSVRK
jgi:hypothetical protein